MEAATATNIGYIEEIQGVVIEAVFPERLPEINHAITVPRGERRRGGRGDRRDRRRAARLRGPAAPRRQPRPRRRDGLDRRARARRADDRHRRPDHGAGRPGDARAHLQRPRRADRPRRGAAGRRRAPRRSTRRRRASRTSIADDRDVRDRDQGRRPARALRQGRQGRPVRRRRRRQDRADPGADPQPRQGARRPVGVLRRRRALARGQRPLARDEGVGRPRQDDALLRADERAAGRAHARRAVGADDGRVLPRPGPGRAAVHRQHLPLRAGRLRGLGAARPDALAGRLPADARDRDGPAAGADQLDADRLGHLGPGDLRARPTTSPTPRRRRCSRTSTRRRRSRGRSRRRASTRPSTRSTRRRRSSSRTSSARITSASPTPSRRSSSATRSCRTSSRSSASTSSPTRTRSPSSARARSSASSRSRSTSPSSSPARPGAYVPIAETIRGFDELIQGKHDDVPERAFFLKGTIDQVLEAA